MSRATRVLVVFGTRPEAIKVAPVIAALTAAPEFEVITCATGQHREILDQVVRLFDLTITHDLNVMKPDQDLFGLTAALLAGIQDVLRETQPDLVLVQGDTTTAVCAALAAYYARVPVAHLEAGLRTADLYAPWPEEGNRRIVSTLAAYHFAPTDAARANLLKEGVDPSTIHVTGNTVIDALLQIDVLCRTDATWRAGLAARYHYLRDDRRLVLVTSHRRESFGAQYESICAGIRQLAAREDVQILYPVHPNPNVRDVAYRLLSGVERVHLVDPLPYVDFVYLMRRAHLILTDSGGVQEEAPSLATPVLVLRETTERPEAVDAGTARIVGTNGDTILRAATELLDDDAAHVAMTGKANPYGDGRAAARVVAVLRSALCSTRQQSDAAVSIMCAAD